MHNEEEFGEIECVPVSDVLPNNDNDNERKDRGKWSSQMDYLLSVIGYSVSLTNVLRFPYMCSQNGGGAFLIPFIVCLVLCGLPLFFLEVAIGQFCGKSAVHVWVVCPLMKGLGIGMMTISGIGVAVYTVFCAWTLYYAVFSCRTILPWTDCTRSWNSEQCFQSIKSLKAITSTVLKGSEINSTLVPINRTRGFAFRGWENSTQAHTAAEEFWQ
ncbi:sodium- and chloride-dependent neutral and basic amino acid transporter B(0+)-like [Haliotis rufescens]|uniref:sodium- and chloride-dependent neutral and basic amino acid transporter B(0+)-like n=1 Tax=Haliotis rufescens TaxID=6454 RepID=UPI00201F55C5|nr:sodium- and chloride-dependent neutral and basic amino acid transporter B(0+)-like [Haliotis rufescens]